MACCGCTADRQESVVASGPRHRLASLKGDLRIALFLFIRLPGRGFRPAPGHWAASWGALPAPGRPSALRLWPSRLSQVMGGAWGWGLAAWARIGRNTASALHRYRQRCNVWACMVGFPDGEGSGLASQCAPAERDLPGPVALDRVFQRSVRALAGDRSSDGWNWQAPVTASCCRRMS